MALAFVPPKPTLASLLSRPERAQPCTRTLHGQSGGSAQGSTALTRLAPRERCAHTLSPSPSSSAPALPSLRLVRPLPRKTKPGRKRGSPVRTGWGSPFLTTFISCYFPLEIIPAGRRAWPGSCCGVPRRPAGRGEGAASRPCGSAAPPREGSLQQPHRSPASSRV